MVTCRWQHCVIVTSLPETVIKKDHFKKHLNNMTRQQSQSNVYVSTVHSAIQTTVCNSLSPKFLYHTLNIYLQQTQQCCCNMSSLIKQHRRYSAAEVWKCCICTYHHHHTGLSAFNLSIKLSTSKNSLTNQTLRNQCGSWTQVFKSILTSSLHLLARSVTLVKKALVTTTLCLKKRHWCSTL